MKKNLVPILVALALLISGTALGFGLKKNLRPTGAVAVQIQNYKPVTPSGGQVATSSEFVGSLVPSVNNAFTLGTAAASWRDIYASWTVRIGGNTATGTLNLQTAPAGIKGRGTWVPLTAADGTQVFLSATSSPSALAPWTVLAISTASCL